MIIPFTNSPANINLSHSIVAKPRVLQDFKPLRYHHPSHKFSEAPHIVNVWVPFYTIKKEHILLALFFTVYNYCNTSNCVPLLSAFLHNHLKYGILHYILYLWCIRVVSNEVGDLSSLSLESLYPLSPHQTAILADITAALSSRQCSVSDDNHSAASQSSWHKYLRSLGEAWHWEVTSADPCHFSCHSPWNVRSSGRSCSLAGPRLRLYFLWRGDNGYSAWCFQHPNWRALPKWNHLPDQSLWLHCRQRGIHEKCFKNKTI